jgi:hypothetical protein
MTTDGVAAAAERSAMANDLLDVVLRLSPRMQPPTAAAEHLGSSVRTCLTGGRLSQGIELAARLCRQPNALLYAHPAAPFGDASWLLPPLVDALQYDPDKQPADELASPAASALARLVGHEPHCAWLADRPKELRSLLVFVLPASALDAPPKLRAAAGCVCDALYTVARSEQLTPESADAIAACWIALTNAMVTAGPEAAPRIARLLSSELFAVA